MQAHCSQAIAMVGSVEQSAQIIKHVQDTLHRRMIFDRNMPKDHPDRCHALASIYEIIGRCNIPEHSFLLSGVQESAVQDLRALVAQGMVEFFRLHKENTQQELPPLGNIFSFLADMSRWAPTANQTWITGEPADFDIMYQLLDSGFSGELHCGESVVNAGAWALLDQLLFTDR